jgi:hypothetical protein
VRLSQPGPGAKIVPNSSRRPELGAEPDCSSVWFACLRVLGPGRRRWAIRWKPALNAFDIAFDGRLSAGRK